MKNITLNFKHSSSALIFSYSVNVWLAIKLLHWGIYNSPCKTCTSFARLPVKIWLRNQTVQSKLISIIFAEQNEHSNPSERIGLCRAFTTTFNRRRLCQKRTMLSLSLLLEYHGQFSHWGDFSCNFCCNFNRRSQVIFGPALGQPSPVANGWWRPKVKFFLIPVPFDKKSFLCCCFSLVSERLNINRYSKTRVRC